MQTNELPKVGDLATVVSRVDNATYNVRIVRAFNDVQGHVEVRVIGFVPADRYHKFGEMWAVKSSEVTLSA